MKSDYLVYAVLAVVVGLAVYTGFDLVKDTRQPNPVPAGKNPGFRTITSGDTETGNVQIDLTPVGLENGRFKIDIAVNTHSVDLSQFDLKQITTLEYGGKSFKPDSAPQMSGHHVSGSLFFDTGADMGQFTVTIAGVPKTEKRIFEWR